MDVAIAKRFFQHFTYTSYHIVNKRRIYHSSKFAIVLINAHRLYHVFCSKAGNQVASVVVKDGTKRILKEILLSKVNDIQ